MKTADDVLTELAPYLNVMEQAYLLFRTNFLEDGQDEEQADSSASLGAVMSGLALSRGSREVKEHIDNIYVAQQNFRIYMSLNRLIRAGMLKAEIIGEDENGWPKYKLLEAPKDNFPC